MTNTNSSSSFDDNDFNPTIALLKLIDAREAGLIRGETANAKIAELQARVNADIFGDMI